MSNTEDRTERSSGMGASAGWFKDGEDGTNKYNFGHRHPDKMASELDKHERSMEHYRERFASAGSNDTSGASTSSSHAVFDKEGAIGKQFSENGALGGTAAKVGGPLASDGIVGKQFTDTGAVGGTVQSVLGDSK